MNKIRLTEAAKIIGVHPNTIRNWLSAGKLKTAEKVRQGGNQVWMVDLAEVAGIAQVDQEKLHYTPNNSNNNPTNKTLSDSLQSPQESVSEQTLLLIREGVVGPLVELLERQARRIEELSAEVGELRAELRRIKGTE